MGMLIGIAATAATFFIVAYFLPQIEFTGDIPQLLIIAVLFGIVNAFVKPVVKLLSFPINMATLGLFGIVINAVLLLGVGYVAAEFFNVPISIGGFPPNLTADAFLAALFASIAIGIVGAIVGMIVPD